jgi:hypothetical protein
MELTYGRLGAIGFRVVSALLVLPTTNINFLILGWWKLRTTFSIVSQTKHLLRNTFFPSTER